MRVVNEIHGLEQALTAWKEKFGDYPPDFAGVNDTDKTKYYNNSSWTTAQFAQATVYMHLQNAFPRYGNASNWTNISSNLKSSGIDSTLLDPSTALVFWLGGMPVLMTDSSGNVNGILKQLNGFSADPGNPFDTSASRIPPFFQFDTSRLIAISANTVANTSVGRDDQPISPQPMPVTGSTTQIAFQYVPDLGVRIARRNLTSTSVRGAILVDVEWNPQHSRGGPRVRPPLSVLADIREHLHRHGNHQRAQQRRHDYSHEIPDSRPSVFSSFSQHRHYRVVLSRPVPNHLHRAGRPVWGYFSGWPARRKQPSRPKESRRAVRPHVFRSPGQRDGGNRAFRQHHQLWRDPRHQMNMHHAETVRTAERERKTLRDAFTLVELLAVITIIGILASLISVAVVAAKKRFTVMKVVNEIHGLETALAAYKHRFGEYPPDFAGMCQKTIPSRPVSPVRNVDVELDANLRIGHRDHANVHPSHAVPAPAERLSAVWLGNHLV